MPAQDTTEVKDKIITTLKTKGPSLPVHIAKEINLSILFTSVFLSELLSEKRLKMSHMRVGSSPIYFTPGQEALLEKYSQHLKSKEKDAYTKLKEKRFLRDSEQDPAIRVALRAIRDFAIPFKRQDEIFWRYYIIPEQEFEIKEKQEVALEPVKEDIRPQVEKSQPQETHKPHKISRPKKEKNKEKIKKTNGKRQNEKFFNKVKEFLSKESIEIIEIYSFSSEDIKLKVKINDINQLLVAYNKKRINEEEIIKAHKKAAELSLPYSVLSLGEPLKKLNNFIEALKNIKEIKKMDG
mgnify:CR=1 FL=1